jgi:hypothetical protein
LLKECGSLSGSFFCLNGGGTKEMNKKELRVTRKQMSYALSFTPNNEELKAYQAKLKELLKA